MTEPTTPDNTAGDGADASRPSWHRGTLVGFDLETTGTDPTTARIVSAALSYVGPDGSIDARSRHWLVDPGIPIPQAASDVHGISTEQARAHGIPEKVAAGQILDGLDAAWRAGLPVVVFNAAYDLTLMAAAAARHGLAPPTGRASWPAAWIVDPLVIDREVDRYRRGKRTLQAAVEHYRVAASGAHSADGDAAAACQLARVIARDHPMIGNAEPAMLHRAQVHWYGAWAARFQEYLRSKGSTELIDGTWPVRAV